MNKQIYILTTIFLVSVIFLFGGSVTKAKDTDLQRGAWWGKINSSAVVVRKEPDSKSQRLGLFSTINRVKVLDEVKGEEIEGNNKWYQIDGGAHPGAYIFSGLVTEIDQPTPPKNLARPKKVSSGEHWIDVDLSRNVLTLAKGNSPVFATYVAVGTSDAPTITGTFRVWYKIRSVRMNLSPPVVPRAYDLPNVPDTMFYHRSYAIHGTYWHDKFGTRQSSGCTNLTRGDAAYLFSLTSPSLAESQKALRVTTETPSTVIVNHY
jgi:lipoprotein-anchoring transpeptidase ErfK/SrfK